MACPQRTCAVTRAVHPVGDLIRFVAGPDGAIVSDLARRLPGRGVWVTLARDKVAEAAARNVFARSLKRVVRVDRDLAAHVEALLEKRVGEALSLANKAGLVVPGFAQINEGLETSDFAGLLHGAGASQQGCEKLDRKLRAIAQTQKIEAVIAQVLTIDQMGLALGRPNVVHALLISGGATVRLLEEVKRLVRYRTSSDEPLKLV